MTQSSRYRSALRIVASGAWAWPLSGAAAVQDSAVAAVLSHPEAMLSLVAVVVVAGTGWWWHRRRRAGAGDRVRELNCLYATAAALTAGAPRKQTLEALLAALPDGFSEPSRVEVRLSLDGEEHQTAGWRDATGDGGAFIGADVKAGDTPFGRLEVAYRPDRRGRSPAFRAEETWLLESVAQQVVVYLERDRARQALRRSKTRLRQLMDTATEGICHLRADGRVRYANRLFLELLEAPASDVVGRSIYELVPADIAQRLREGFRQGRRGDTLRYELYTERVEGQPRWLLVSASMEYDDNGSLAGVFAMVTDITEQKLATQRAEEARERLEALQGRMMRTEKLASIGQLAAGVAHEINNPLAYVKSNLGTLREYLRYLTDAVTAAGVVDEQLDFVRDDLPELLDECEDGLRRVTTIIATLKGLARDGAGDWGATDVNEAVTDALRIVSPSLSGRGELTRELSQLPSVEGSSSQLAQVFVNLLTNAMKALGDWGRIRVATWYDASAGYVMVEVADNGEGIPKEALNRIFDPFYTTANAGEGTGLGLAMVHTIIERHGGSIDVASEPGQGTTFRLALPA